MSIYIHLLYDFEEISDVKFNYSEGLKHKLLKLKPYKKRFPKTPSLISGLSSGLISIYTGSFLAELNYSLYKTVDTIIEYPVLSNLALKNIKEHYFFSTISGMVYLTGNLVFGYVMIKSAQITSKKYYEVKKSGIKNQIKKSVKYINNTFNYLKYFEYKKFFKQHL